MGNASTKYDEDLLKGCVSARDKVVETGVSVQRMVSSAVTVATTVDVQLSNTSIVSNAPLAENEPGT